jgi:hypothetical protein
MTFFPLLYPLLLPLSTCPDKISQQSHGLFVGKRAVGADLSRPPPIYWPPTLIRTPTTISYTPEEGTGQG